MLSCLCVGIGGALGAMLRYLIGLIPSGAAFPYKTLIINVLGSFLIGIIAGITSHHTEINADFILFLKVGVCGGFTTFSTFALESSDMIQRGHIGAAVIYMAASVVLSLCAVVLADILIK